MPPALLMRPAPAQVVAEIRGLKLEDKLPILVRREGETLTGYRKVGAPGSQMEYAEVSPAILIHVETNVFRAMIEEGSSRLPEVAPSLHELRRRTHEAERTLSRTIKMLRCLDALLVEPFVDLTEEEAPLQALALRLRRDVPPLDRALRLLSAQTLPREGCWFYYVPLLMVVAVAFSQCECHLPIFWQAFSAGRAKNDLRGRWHDLDEEILDFIALLIRCQSSYRQLSRGSGDDRFHQLVDEVAGAPGRRLGSETLDAGLRVMAVLEDMRHHRLPGFEETDDATGPAWNDPSWFLLTRECLGTRVAPGLSRAARERLRRACPRRFRGRERLRAFVAAQLRGEPAGPALKGIVRAAGMTPARRAAEFFDTHLGGAFTWGYSNGLDVAAADMRAFKTWVEANYGRYLEGGGPVPAPGEIAMFSFDRTQAEDLRSVLARHVTSVAADPERRFAGSFQLQGVEVPHFRGAPRSERVIAVALNDEIAAEALLFPDSAEGDRPTATPPGSGGGAGAATAGAAGAGKDKSAGALFVHLLERAVEEFGLAAAAVAPKQPLYLPFPLVRRLLNITYRLRPQSCGSIRITFRPDDLAVLHVPLDLAGPAAACVAHYVHAAILNHAMSRGFQECDVDMGGLPPAWQTQLEEAYKANGYRMLLEDYLQQYNAERESNLELLKETEPGTLRRVPVPALRAALCEFLRLSDRPAPYVFLGVDIGGTLTKFQLYELDPRRQELVERGDNFKILTTAKKEGRAPGPPQIEGSAAEFAGRLVKTIAANLAPNGIGPQHVVAIGLSWPGPVRANQVAGTSGIFRNFPPLSTIIDENDRHAIHRLDIVEAVESAWRPFGAATSISLLNDGDADGTGVLYSLAAGQNGLGRPAEDPPDGTEDEDEDPPRVAVVKLGTGTAGALFRSGRLEPGLNEWGKLLLDLGSFWDRGFPRGLANGYLSSKTLPNLVRRRIADGSTALLDVPDLDSLELGLLLAAGSAGFGAESFRGKGFQRLRDEACGIKEFASRGAPEGIDAEVIRRVLEKGAKAEPELFPTLELYVGFLGMKARKVLQQKVELFGKVRLARLLHLQGEDFRQIAKGWPRIRRALAEAYDVAVDCARTLGTYLGDFVVLVHDVADVRTVILGGGVLSGRTGELVREAAAARIRRYGLRCTADGAILHLARRGEGEPARLGAGSANGPARPPAARRDFGTLGAAVFAASEFLFERKREGMKEIKTCLTRLLGNQSLTLLADRVLCDQQDSTVLAHYALTQKDVADFLKQYGPDLGFRRSTGSDPDRIVYTRWIREN